MSNTRPIERSWSLSHGTPPHRGMTSTFGSCCHLKATPKATLGFVATPNAGASPRWLEVGRQFMRVHASYSLPASCNPGRIVLSLAGFHTWTTLFLKSTHFHHLCCFLQSLVSLFALFVKRDTLEEHPSDINLGFSFGLRCSTYTSKD